jgi:hypothetical protein
VHDILHVHICSPSLEDLKTKEARFSAGFLKSASRSTTTATPLIFAWTAVISPPGIAQIQITRVRDGANNCAADATNYSACCGVTRRCANRGASSGADQAPRYRAFARRRAASRKRKSADRNGAIHQFS